MNLPAPATYRIDEASHYALWKLMFRRSWKNCFFVSLPGVAIIAGLVGWAEQSLVEAIGLTVLGAFVASIFVAVMRLALKPRARKVYRESASLQEEMTLTFEDEGFRVEQPSGLWRVKWDQLVRWDEDNDIFAVFPNRNMAIIFPKRQVSEDIVNTMREQMNRSGLSLPWKLRK